MKLTCSLCQDFEGHAAPADHSSVVRKTVFLLAYVATFREADPMEGVQVEQQGLYFICMQGVSLIQERFGRGA